MNLTMAILRSICFVIHKMWSNIEVNKIIIKVLKRYTIKSSYKIYSNNGGKITRGNDPQRSNPQNEERSNEGPILIK